MADPPSTPVRVFMLGEGSATEPQRDAKGRWMPAAKASVQSVSALAYHVGRQLAAERNVPVGVICVTGTYAIESWMSRETLTATPEATPVLDYYHSAAWKNRTVGTYEQRLAAWLEMQRKLPLNPPPKPRPDDVDMLPKQKPSGIWNACLAPLVPAALSGIVWNAGEDWGSQSRAFQHGQLLPIMIASWRSAFGDAQLPVAIVQTRPHLYAVPFGLDGRLAAELREAQRAAANKATAHIVTTIDLEADPTAREVAPRIVGVLQGRGRSGPVLAGSQTQGDKVILHFTENRVEYGHRRSRVLETRSGLELQQILEQDDVDACLRSFSQATEAERRALSGIALAAMPTQFPLLSAGESPWWQVRAIAVLASCSFAELQQRGWLWLPEWDRVCAVLAARRPDWIDEFAEAILDFSTGWWGHVRRLVREGLCRKPRTAASGGRAGRALDGP